MNNRPRKKTFVFLLLIILIVGIVFLDKKGRLDKAKNIAYVPVTSIQGVMYKLSNGSAVFVKDLFSFDDIKKENEDLKLANEKILATDAVLKEIDSENSFLRKQLGVPLKDGYSLEIANVVGEGSGVNHQKLIIDKGTTNQIKEGSAVITAGGVMIGKIVKTYENRSEAILINDPESKIPVLLQDSRAQGIVHGEYGTGVILDFVPAENNIALGEKIVTLAADNIPQGLLVGEVEDIISQSGGLFKKAVVSPTASFKNIDKIFIIIK